MIDSLAGAVYDRANRGATAYGLVVYRVIAQQARAIGLSLRRFAPRLAAAAAIFAALIWLAFAASDAQGVPPRTGASLAPYNGAWQKVASIVPGSAAWNAGLRPGQVVRVYDTSPSWLIIVTYVREKSIPYPRDNPVIVTRRWSEGDSQLLLTLGLAAAIAAGLVFARTARLALAVPFLGLNGAAAALLLMAASFHVEAPWAQPASWILSNVLAFALASLALTVPRRRGRWVRFLLLGCLVALVVTYAYVATLRPAAFDALDRTADYFRLACAGATFLGILRSTGRAEWPDRWPGIAAGLLLTVVLVLSTAPYSRSPLIDSPLQPVVEWAIWALVPIALGLPIWRDVCWTWRGERASDPAGARSALARFGDARGIGDSGPEDRAPGAVALAGSAGVSGGFPRRSFGEGGAPLSAPIHLGGAFAEEVSRLRSAGLLGDAEVSIGEMPAVRVESARLQSLTTDLLGQALAAAGSLARPRLRVWAERRRDAVRVWVVVSVPSAGSAALASDAGAVQVGAASPALVATRAEAISRFWTDFPLEEASSGRSAAGYQGESVGQAR